VLEAKRFERPLDKRGAKAEKYDSGTPSGQILRYLSNAEVASNGKILWGILTNGRHWRLYYHKAKSRTEGFIEFDLDLIFAPESGGLFQITAAENYFGGEQARRHAHHQAHGDEALHLRRGLERDGR
jgi:hypothetical protein